jgi:hypothetical protein
MARRTGRFPQLVDPRGSVNGLLLIGSPRFREVSLEERRSLCRLNAVCGRRHPRAALIERQGDLALCEQSKSLHD